MKDAQYVDMPLGKIREPAHQLRERIDPEALGQLADSIAAEGLHQPIGVRGPDAENVYEIVWGHRRYLAHKLLQRPTITARVFPQDYDPLLAAVSENLNRAQLNPVEEANAVSMFIDRGYPRAEIARLFRRSPVWVEQRIALLQLPPDLLAAISEHGLPLAVAAQLADVDHEPYRRQLVYEAVTHGATATVAAVWRQHYLSDRDRITRNDVAVETIIQERDRFILKYPCDWCDKEVPYRETRTLRLCLGCAGELEAAKTSQPTEGGS